LEKNISFSIRRLALMDRIRKSKTFNGGKSSVELIRNKKNNMKDTKMVTIEEIISAAKNEQWDFVDKQIPLVCNVPEVIDRSSELLTDSDGNLRDLGASILAKAKLSDKKYNQVRPTLFKNLGDSHIYARYRAAFALAEHDQKPYDKEILNVLGEASEDPEVGEIAKKYSEKHK
jgi:hypothetical protein